MAYEQPTDAVTIDLFGLDLLISVLRGQGYALRGPVVRDGAIVPGDIEDVHSLPIGFHDRQEPGIYRLDKTDDDEVFGWAVGPQSLKGEFFPPESTLWRTSDVDEPAILAEEPNDIKPIAFIGARPCELVALSVLDRVLVGGNHPDTRYAERRRGAFVVVVECSTPSAVCFCTSMGSGPGAVGNYDLALTELLNFERDPADPEGASESRFLVRAGSEAGRSLLTQLLGQGASETDWNTRNRLLDHACEKMGDRLDTLDLPAMLARNLDHPRWAEVAERCLACGNCTTVCPTCFCSDVHDVSDLSGGTERQRRWSSCFELSHSFLHGGSVRTSTYSRYRQWATHKLSTWTDQFGTSGCVGCGRCIAWCPVGIDITEEVRAIRADDGAKAADAAGEATQS